MAKVEGLIVFLEHAPSILGRADFHALSHLEELVGTRRGGKLGAAD